MELDFVVLLFFAIFIGCIVVELKARWYGYEGLIPR